MGPLTPHAPYYIVTLVAHDQSRRAERALASLESSLRECGLPADTAIHTAPLVRREGPYRNLDLAERRKAFSHLEFFARTCVRDLGVRAKGIVIDKRLYGSGQDLADRLAREMGEFVMGQLEFFQPFDRVIVYYDRCAERGHQDAEHRIQRNALRCGIPNGPPRGIPALPGGRPHLHLGTHQAEDVGREAERIRKGVFRQPQEAPEKPPEAAPSELVLEAGSTRRPRRSKVRRRDSPKYLPYQIHPPRAAISPGLASRGRPWRLQAPRGCRERGGRAATVSRQRTWRLRWPRTRGRQIRARAPAVTPEAPGPGSGPPRNVASARATPAARRAPPVTGRAAGRTWRPSCPA